MFARLVEQIQSWTLPQPYLLACSQPDWATSSLGTVSPDRLLDPQQNSKLSGDPDFDLAHWRCLAFTKNELTAGKVGYDGLISDLSSIQPSSDSTNEIDFVGVDGAVLKYQIVPLPKAPVAWIVEPGRSTVEVRLAALSHLVPSIAVVRGPEDRLALLKENFDRAEASATQ